LVRVLDTPRKLLNSGTAEWTQVGGSIESCLQIADAPD